MSTSDNYIIEFCNVSKKYVSNELALKNANFRLKLGEMAFLTGHSGAGKSTMLKLIAAMESPTEGEIYISSQNSSHLSKRGIASLRRSIGIVFQEAHLLFDYSVFENVSFPLSFIGISRKNSISMVNEALNVVGLSSKANCYPQDLSVGEKQRVCIARAIAHNPPLLLADEPTGNLDQKLALEIINLFIALNKRGMSILVATHNLTLIAPLHYRMLTLKNGILAQ